MHTNRRTQRGGRHGFNGQDVNLIRNSHRDELQNERLVCVNVLYFFEVDYSPDNRTPFFSLLTTKIYNSVESELLNSNFPYLFLICMILPKMLLSEIACLSTTDVASLHIT